MTNGVDRDRLSFQASVFFGAIRTVGGGKQKKKKSSSDQYRADTAPCSGMCAESRSLLLCNSLTSTLFPIYNQGELNDIKAVIISISFVRSHCGCE